MLGLQHRSICCPLASPGRQLHGTPILRRGFLCCTAFGLEYRFATTYSLLCLHVWLALVRLRVEAKDGKDLAQMMYDNFQEDVEIRVRAEGVKVSISLLATEQLLTERFSDNISMECEDMKHLIMHGRHDGPPYNLLTQSRLGLA